MQNVSIEDLVRAVPADRQASARMVFERAFDSLLLTEVLAGKVANVSPVRHWAHRSAAQVESDLAYLAIDREGMLSAFASYLGDTTLTSDRADWFFLNVLVYAEFVGTVGAVRKRVMGVERYVQSLCPPSDVYVSDVGALASRRWHVPAAAVSIAAGFAVHPLAAAAVAGGLLLAARRRRRAYDEVNATLSAMLETYLSLNTTDLSWPHVTATLARSQSAGAIWDASLYALADRRTRRSQDEHAFS